MAPTPITSFTDDPDMIDLDMPFSCAKESWRSDSRGTARRFACVAAPAPSMLATLYDAVVADIAVARPACGW